MWVRAPPSVPFNFFIFIHRIREKTLQIFLCLFFGFIGAHRFYEGDILKGILYAATWGFLGIGIVVDLIRIIFDLY